MLGPPPTLIGFNYTKNQSRKPERIVNATKHFHNNRATLAHIYQDMETLPNSAYNFDLRKQLRPG